MKTHSIVDCTSNNSSLWVACGERRPHPACPLLCEHTLQFTLDMLSSLSTAKYADLMATFLCIPHLGLLFHWQNAFLHICSSADRYSLQWHFASKCGCHMRRNTCWFKKLLSLNTFFFFSFILFGAVCVQESSQKLSHITQTGSTVPPYCGMRDALPVLCGTSSLISDHV